MHIATLKNSTLHYFYIVNFYLLLILYCPLVNANFIAWDNENDKWLTQTSEHFSISYLAIHQSNADHVLKIAEQVHRELIPFFKNMPDKRTDIILFDDSDYAIPTYSALEQGEIRLLMTPPTEVIDLAEQENWIYLFLSNEYSNILHFQLAKGTLRGFFLSPEFTPSLLIEGLSLYLTSHVQLQSKQFADSKFAMKMRMEVANKELKQLQQVILSNKEWPLESVYLYGAYFIQYLAATYGEDKVFAFLENYNQDLFAYLLLNSETEKVFAKDFLTLWKDFQDYLYVEFSAQISALEKHKVNGELLARSPFLQTFANHGEGLLSSSANGENRHKIVTYKNQQWQQVSPVKNLVAMDSHPQGGIAITRNIAYLDGRQLNDIFIYDNHDWTQITERQRYKYIRWMPNGKQLLASRNVAELSELWLIDVDTNIVAKQIWQGQENEILGNFAVAADGSYLVAAIKRPFQAWKLARFDFSAQTWQNLTQLKGSESNPQFLDDGRIIYSANYTGIYNIYVLDEKQQNIQQWTNVIGGAFHPVWQQELGLVFQTYGSDSYMLRTLKSPVALSEFSSVGTADAKPHLKPKLKQVEQKINISTPLPYSTWSTVKPHSWIPALFVDEVRTLVGLNTYGGDALGRHNYDIYLMWDAQNELASYLLQYTYDNRWLVEYLRDYKYKNITPEGDPNYQISRNQTYLLERNNMFSTWEDTLSFHAGFSFRQDNIVYTPEHEQLSVTTDSDESATEINGGLALTFDNREYYLNVDDVGWGHYLDFTYHENFFANDFSGRKYQTQWRGTWDMPKKVTILTRFAGGYSTRDAKQFTLGGHNFREEMRLFDRNSQSLRGYDDAALNGHYYFTQRIELNASLARIEKNLALFPLGFGDLTSTFFVDSGSAWNNREEFEQLTGIGAEFKLDFKLGYNYSLPITLGYANGLDNKKGREYFYINFGVIY